VNNGVLRAPRELRRRIRAAIHGGQEDPARLRGWIEYVRMVNLEDGDKLRAQLEASQ
jgi:hypothetical protein